MNGKIKTLIIILAAALIFALSFSAAADEAPQMTEDQIHESGQEALSEVGAEEPELAESGAKLLPTPELSAENAAGGVRISWNAIDGAEAYRVYVKNGSGWSNLTDTKQTVWLDESAESGVTYTYTVRCITSKGKAASNYDTVGKSIKYIAAPVLKYADGGNSGIELSWVKSAGAAKYRVFRKTSDGWARLSDTTSVSYTDKTAKTGNTYTYTVRCLSSDGSYCSSYYSEGITATLLETPAISSLTSGKNGVDIKWDPVAGAVRYRLYRYGNNGWERLAETDVGSYTDASVVSGRSYTYTVRCISSDSLRFTSGHLSGKSVDYVAAPVISMTNAETGVKISWKASAGAGRYRVYYYGRKGWTRMADTTSTSYLDEDVSSGGNYTYTVRCLNSSGSAFVSDFIPAEKHMFVAPPSFSLSLAPDGVNIGWNAVKGAGKYRVYRYKSSGWTKLADITETSYTDRTAPSGENCKYTVRCLNAEGTKAVSDYFAGKSVKFVAAPKITSLTNTSNGVSLKWDAVKGASKYRVYHKNIDGGWTRIAETASDTYKDTSVQAGKEYTYTLRCVNSAGTAFESDFYREGATVLYIVPPKNIKAESSGNSVLISWTKSDGAVRYRVYRYNGSGWTRLGDTTGNTFTDETVVSGNKYRYTVRCLSADGKSFTSDYDRAGATCEYCEMPVLNAPVNGKDGVELSWKESPGAAKYRVYYYGKKGWTKLCETKETSAVDTDVLSNRTYRYTVRCLSADGKSFTSDCDTKGVTILYIAAPRLLDYQSTSKHLTFTWSESAGASSYRVYKKVNGSWVRQTDTSSTSFTDKNVSLGSTYIYTVRCLGADGDPISGFDPNGFTFTVTGSDFVYYNQLDYDYPYGDDTIAYSGCGPTCFAMIASTVKGESITPIDAVEWCGNDYYMMNVGTYWSYFEAASRHFGVNYCGDTESTSEVIAALKKGKYVISSQKPGIFTSAGHFITLAGIDADGKIIVYDPNGWRGYIGVGFSPEDVFASGTHYWIFEE